LVSTDTGITAKLPSPRYLQKRSQTPPVSSKPNSGNQKNANIIRKMELQSRLKEKLKRKAMMTFLPEDPLSPSSYPSSNSKKHNNNSNFNSKTSGIDHHDNSSSISSSIPSSPKTITKKRTMKKQKANDNDLLSIPDLVDMLIPMPMITRSTTEFTSNSIIINNNNSNINNPLRNLDDNQPNLKSDDTLLPFLDNSYLDLDFVPRGEASSTILKDDFPDLWDNMDENMKNKDEMLYPSLYFFNNFIS